MSEDDAYDPLEDEDEEKEETIVEEKEKKKMGKGWTKVEDMPKPKRKYTRHKKPESEEREIPTRSKKPVCDVCGKELLVCSDCKKGL